MISAAVLRNPEKRARNLERIGSVYRDRRTGEVAVDFTEWSGVPPRIRAFSGVCYTTYTIYPGNSTRETPIDLTPTDVLLDLLHEYELVAGCMDDERIQWYAGLLRVVDSWDECLEGWDGGPSHA